MSEEIMKARSLGPWRPQGTPHGQNTSLNRAAGQGNKGTYRGRKKLIKIYFHIIFYIIETYNMNPPQNHSHNTYDLCFKKKIFINMILKNLI